MQFNTLADALSDAFPHVSSKRLLSWTHREPLLHRVLTDHPCDFFCLEEVDHFADSFQPLLSGLGYEGVFAQRRHSADPISLDGTALFWRKSRFSLLDHALAENDGKTFGLVGLFHDAATSHTLSVCCLHLTAKDRGETRLSEIAAFYAVLSRVAPAGTAVLIGGDFNDVPESPVCQFLRDRAFSSAYSHPPSSWSTWKKRDTEVKRVIDFIWYRSGDASSLQLLDTLPIPDDSHFPACLPDLHFPSDHINIAALFAL